MSFRGKQWWPEEINNQIEKQFIIFMKMVKAISMKSVDSFLAAWQAKDARKDLNNKWSFDIVLKKAISIFCTTNNIFE